MMRRRNLIILILFLLIVYLGVLSDGTDGFVTSLFFAFVVLLIGFGVRFFTHKKKKDVVPTLTKHMEEHYEESGMTNREIEMFRSTMNQTKQEINQLQKNMQAVAKLKSIDLRYDTVKVSKALFKELVKDPQKLHLAGHFLYTHLPNLVDLTDKYIEIANHEIKTKETYSKLEESSQIIEKLAQLIATDYQQFVQDDLTDIDVEISIAKQSLKRDNETNTDHHPDEY